MKVGEYYKHFKGNNIYKIIAVNVSYTGESAGTELEELVVYQNINDKRIFVREYNELTEELSKEKQEKYGKKYRIEKLEEDELKELGLN